MMARITRVDGSNPAWLDVLDGFHRDFLSHHGFTTPPRQFTDFVAARIADDEMLVILSWVDDTPVGYGLAFDVPSHPFIPDWQRSGYLTNLYTIPGRRGEGIGQQMFDHILEWLARRGLGQVMLNVGVDNAGAEKFWRKQGFNPYLLRMHRSIP